MQDNDEEYPHSYPIDNGEIINVSSHPDVTSSEGFKLLIEPLVSRGGKTSYIKLRCYNESNASDLANHYQRRNYLTLNNISMTVEGRFIRLE